MSKKFHSDISFPDDNKIKLGTGEDAEIYVNNDELIIQNTTSDKDIVFNINDGGSTVEAIRIDAENSRIGFFNSSPSKIVSITGTFQTSGESFFNNFDVTNGSSASRFRDGHVVHFNTNRTANIFTSSNDLYITNSEDDKDMLFRCDDGAGGIETYFRLDGSAATHDGSANTAKFTVWGDNSRVSLGDGNDLNLYHDGSNSYISEDGTGVLYIRSGGSTSVTVNGTAVTFAGNATVNGVLTLGQGDHVIEDGSNILDENDNTMITLASGVANITGNAATATALTSGNKTIAGVLDITDTTDSSDATGDTGALRCEGGASIAKKLFAGSTITGSADVIAFSDRKLKDNIETLDGKKVLDMRGVSFTRKDTGLPGSGVIAQEIQKVAPELIHDTNGTLGVAYGNLVGYLIEAIKDQQKQIDELKEMCSGCSK